MATLNQQLWAWLDEVYHARVHSETKQTPLARFIAGRRTLLDPETVHDAFLWRAHLHDVMLEFDGADHVDEFLSRFADAWARWDHSDEEEAVPLLQQTLPF